MTPQEKLRQILTTYPKGLYAIDTLEISHPLFTQTYYLTREPFGITAFDDGGIERDFVGTNIGIELSASKSDLDQDFSFTIPDLENKLDNELELLPLDEEENISAIYRVYNSDDFSEPSDGPFDLNVINVSQKKGIFTIVCGAPQLNWNQTGIKYDYDTFPMLRAL